MSADTIRNLDALLNLKEELLKMKDHKTEKLAQAVQKRKQVQEKLSVIMKCIKATGDRVKQLQDENNLLLTEIISILDRNSNANIVIGPASNNKRPEDGTKDLFLSELMELVDDSSPEDTAETLRLKMVKSLEMCDQKLNEATVLASEYDFHDKLKIAVQLYDDKDRPIAKCKWLEGGFRFQPVSPPLMGSQIRQELILINYVITSFLRRQNVSLESKQESKPAALKTPTKDSTEYSLPTIAKNFVSSRQLSVFILRLFQSNIEIGELHVRPAPTFHPEFVQKLGEFCYKSPKIFCNSIDKVDYNM